VPVFCPNDPFLLYGLQRLGFTRYTGLSHSCHARLASYGCYRPIAKPGGAECGLVFQDATGTIFNQVDTFLAADTIHRLRREVGQLDVHLAMYASQNFSLFRE